MREVDYGSVWYNSITSRKKRWGDLDPVVRIAILNGWDVEGNRCIMDGK